MSHVNCCHALSPPSSLVLPLHTGHIQSTASLWVKLRIVAYDKWFVETPDSAPIISPVSAPLPGGSPGCDELTGGELDIHITSDGGQARDVAFYCLHIIHIVLVVRPVAGGSGKAGVLCSCQGYN